MNKTQELRTQIEILKSQEAALIEDVEALEESVRHIDIDLSNTVAEYVSSTGKQPHEFYRWRRKAKWARYHKEGATQKRRNELRQAQMKLQQAYMMLYAVESGYQGQDTMDLLRAAYHLIMDIAPRADGYEWDESTLGLLQAIKAKADILH